MHRPHQTQAAATSAAQLTRAREHLLRGEMVVATSVLTQALDAAVAMNDRLLMARIRSARGSARARMGQIHAALDDFADAWLDLQEMDEPRDQAILLSNWAAAQVRLGRYEAALSALEQSLQIRIQHGLATAGALLNIGVALGGLGREAAALVRYQQAQDALGPQDDLNLAALIHINLGDGLAKQ